MPVSHREEFEPGPLVRNRPGHTVVNLPPVKSIRDPA